MCVCVCLCSLASSVCVYVCVCACTCVYICAPHANIVRLHTQSVGGDKMNVRQMCSNSYPIWTLSDSGMQDITLHSFHT